MSNLHFYRNRYYAAALGIFTSRDAMWADIHRGWGYVGNSPIAFRDPRGLQVTQVILVTRILKKLYESTYRYWLPEEVRPIYDDIQDRSDKWLEENGDIGWGAIWSDKQCGHWTEGVMKDCHKSPPDSCKDDLPDPDKPWETNRDDVNSMELGPCVLRIIEGEGHSVLQLDCGEIGCWVFDAYWDGIFGGCPRLNPRDCDDYENFSPL